VNPCFANHRIALDGGIAEPFEAEAKEMAAKRRLSPILRQPLPTEAHGKSLRVLRRGKAGHHEPEIITAQTAQGRDHLFVDRSAKET
jgi:hypothetical protein